jgi:hypothetical protein
MLANTYSKIMVILMWRSKEKKGKTDETGQRENASDDRFAFPMTHLHDSESGSSVPRMNALSLPPVIDFPIMPAGRTAPAERRLRRFFDIGSR